MSKRIWIVTGASSDSGAELVRTALASGDAVVATGRNVDRLEALFGEDHANLLTFQMNLRSEAQIGLAAKTAYMRFGKIDVLVNAAVVRAPTPMSRSSKTEREDFFQVNVVGRIHLLRALLPYMRSQGRIINFQPHSIVENVPRVAGNR